MADAALSCERGAVPVTGSDRALRDALAVVRRRLKARGFTAKGMTFYQRVDGGNTIMVSLQKSVESFAAEAKIVINYGVYSARLGERLQSDPSSAVDIWKAHWRKRLTENGREKWLFVNATNDAEDQAQVILAAFESILPDLLDHSTDETLRRSWLSGVSPGITNMQRLLFLAILINEQGPAEQLTAVVAELRSLVSGTVHERFVERQLATAAVRVPL
jgi:Domain of unknown function (DUF4304)